MESSTVAVLRRHPTVWVNILLAVLIVGAAVGVFVLLNNDASANTTVRTATAVVGDVSATVSASGTVDAATTKNLTFPAAGRITNVAVAAGDQVTAGQLLAQVDPTAADAAVATAKAAVATAQSALDQATFDRDQADTAYDDAVAVYADDSTTVQQARPDAGGQASRGRRRAGRARRRRRPTCSTPASPGSAPTSTRRWRGRSRRSTTSSATSPAPTR